MHVVDPNMNIAIQWANGIGPPPALPLLLENVEKRARFADAIDNSLINNSLLHTLTGDQKAQRLKDIAAISREYIPDDGDDNIRANIALRLWSGCLSAAKTIAVETKSGQNTTEMRTSIFSEMIDSKAKEDPIYCAGVEAAPSFKKLRNQDYSLEGVPENSAVRKYP